MNIARDNNQTFSIIHLDDKVGFSCKKVMNREFKDEVICRFSKAITKRDNPLENRFFKIYFNSNTITISPKQNFNFYPFDDSD